MASSRHRGTHSGSSRKPSRSARAIVGLVIGVVALASVAAVRAVAFGDSPSAATFTGVVTKFAGDGSLMCVQRPGSSDAPFCDEYYVAPDTPEIEVDDRVLVTTISSQDKNGQTVSGMLVQPVT